MTKFCIFKFRLWGPLTYITAHIQRHMQTAAGYQLLRQTAPPETYSTFHIPNFRVEIKMIIKKKIKITWTFPILESRRVFKTNQLAKGHRNSFSHVTGRQPLYWLIFVMQCTLDGGLSGRQANQNSVGGGKKQTVDGMCQKGSLCCIHPTMINITTYESQKVWLKASLLMGLTDRISPEIDMLFSNLYVIL